MTKEAPLTPTNTKSLESWIWDAACSIRGAKDAPKYKDYILHGIIDRVDFNATTDQVSASC
jgi:hypothetical protein